MRTTRLLCLFALFGIAFASCAGPTRTADVPIDETSAGRKLYVSKCAKCHKLYDPAKYSEEDWQLWMDKMSKKAKLKSEQKEALSRYIESILRTGKLKPVEKP